MDSVVVAISECAKQHLKNGKHKDYVVFTDNALVALIIRQIIFQDIFTIVCYPAPFLAQAGSSIPESGQKTPNCGLCTNIDVNMHMNMHISI